MFLGGVLHFCRVLDSGCVLTSMSSYFLKYFVRTEDEAAGGAWGHMIRSDWILTVCISCIRMNARPNPEMNNGSFIPAGHMPNRVKTTTSSVAYF
jgi:hypothetical protein